MRRWISHMLKRRLPGISSVQGVSLPRSGHHLLERLLRHYFPEDLYCDFYTCCQCTPCKFGKKIQKHHDLSLQLKNRFDKLHLIQFRREPQAQFEAYFRFFQRLYERGEVTFEVQKHFDYFNNYYNEYYKTFNDSPSVEVLKQSYNRFVNDHVSYYMEFVKKWITNNENPNTFFLAYEDFIRQPSEHLRWVVDLISPQSDIATDKLRDALTSETIALKHDYRQSPLYTSNFDEKYRLGRVTALLQHVESGKTGCGRS